MKIYPDYQKSKKNNFISIASNMDQIVLSSRELLIVFLFFCCALPKAQTFPPGFSQVVVGNIYYPTSMAFAPDGRIFCTEKAGKVKIVKNGVVLPTPFLLVTVDQQGERGLSSVALDPDFNTNHFVYIYYTCTTGTIHNRLSRFTANGDVALAGSEVIILEIEPAVNIIHNSGGMVFGSDGKLFITIGDDEPDSPINYTTPNAQNLNNYKGKILRINTDGSVPAGNPFSGSASANRIWAYGFRNPWTVAIQPGTGKIFVDDVGQDSFEEINDVTAGGKNYGWPFAEGPSSNPAYTNPVYAYPHGANDVIGCAITGGTFFNPASTNYPSGYTGMYFFIDYCNKQINYIDPNNATQQFNFASSIGGANNYLKVGNDGNLYYNSISQSILYKIINNNNNNAPVIITQPSNANVAPGQQATFSVVVSGATPLTYQWQKNGVNISGANSSSYVINNVQSSDVGAYRVMVTNSFGNATSNSATLTLSVLVSCSATGTISREYWANVGGTTVSAIPVNTTPTSTIQLTIFEAPSNVADNYGQRVRGYVCPPQTGNYVFWIASDDNSELWLSSDSTTGNKQKIAYVLGWTSSRQWTKYATQQSVAINLIAGKKYYIEALHKEGSQGDNLAVGWQLPDATLERPIPGVRLSSYTTTTTGTAPLVNITSPANNTTYPSPVNIIINANATSPGGSITKVEFYQGTTLIGQSLTAPYSFTWMNVTTGNYVLTAKAYDNAAQVSTSPGVNVIVTTCPTPIITPSGPTIMCSGSVTLNTTTGSGYVFQWKKDGVNILGATNSSYVASVSGAYQVKVIQGSCIAWSAPANIKIQNGLSASITAGGSTTICSGGNVVLYGNTCGGFTYQWIKDGVNIPGATGSIYTATLAGNYQLRVTQAGLNAWSSIVTVTVKSCIALHSNEDKTLTQQPSSILSSPNDSKGPFHMKVYPNPNNGRFTISLNMTANKEEKASIRMFNTLGEIVYTNEYREENGFINEIVELDNSLPIGIYILQITVGNKVENTNVMLAR